MDIYNLLKAACVQILILVFLLFLEPHKCGFGHILPIKTMITGPSKLTVINQYLRLSHRSSDHRCHHKNDTTPEDGVSACLTEKRALVRTSDNNMPPGCDGTLFLILLKPPSLYIHFPLSSDLLLFLATPSIDFCPFILEGLDITHSTFMTCCHQTPRWENQLCNKRLKMNMLTVPASKGHWMFIEDHDCCTLTII